MGEPRVATLRQSQLAQWLETQRARADECGDGACPSQQPGMAQLSVARSARHLVPRVTEGNARSVRRGRQRHESRQSLLCFVLGVEQRCDADIVRYHYLA